MKKLSIVFILGLIFSLESFGAPVKRYYQDIKLPSQRVLERLEVVNPLAAGTTNVLSANAGATSAAAASVTTFVAQPDVPRNLVITPGGTTGDVESCNVTVTGTNYFGRTITEVFAFAADASSATTGAKAFRTITSIAWAASCESGGFAATWSVGFGEKIGLHRCMAGNHYVFSSVGGTYETTRATIGFDADEVEKNTADFNGTMNGTNDFEIFFVQNYGC